MTVRAGMLLVAECGSEAKKGQSRAPGEAPVTEEAQSVKERELEQRLAEAPEQQAETSEILKAAHLEAHTKAIGRPILIDETTRNGLGEKIRVESHGPVQLKTKSQAVEVYSVIRPSSGSAEIADASRIHGPRQLTDVYLPALAVDRGGRFVTFDASVPLSAIRGAEKKHIVAL